MNLNLKGKRALIGGASQGIGKACAIELAKLGAQTITYARNEEKLKNLVDELNSNDQTRLSSGSKHMFFVCDVSDRLELEKNVYSALEDGPIHILVNNTGGPPAGEISKASEQDFMHAFENHLLVNSLLAQMLLNGMKAEQYGRIINIISTSVKTPLPGLGVSNTVRWAVASWGKSLAYEVAPFGITVNHVLPGATKTPRLEALIKSKADKTGISIEEATEQWLSPIPMKRFGNPEDLGQLVGFLSSPSASYITGCAIPVDGGRTACL